MISNMSIARVLLSRHQCIVVDKGKAAVHQLDSHHPESVIQHLEGLKSLELFLEPPWAITIFQQTQSLSKQEIIYYVQNFATSHQIQSEHIGLASIPMEGNAKGFLLSCLSSSGQELCAKLDQKYIWRPAILAFVTYLLSLEENVLIFCGGYQVFGLSKIKKHLIKIWIAPFAQDRGVSWCQDLYLFADDAKILQMTTDNASAILTMKLPRKFNFRSLKWHTKIRKRDWTQVMLPLLVLIGIYLFGWNVQNRVQENLQEVTKLEAMMAKDQQELAELQSLAKQQEQISQISKVYDRLQRESSNRFQNLKYVFQIIPSSVWLERLTYSKNQIFFHIRALSSQGIPDTLESFNSTKLFQSVQLVSQEPYEDTQRFIIEATLPSLEE